jgi:hypothetical protein
LIKLNIIWNITRKGVKLQKPAKISPCPAYLYRPFLSNFGDNETFMTDAQKKEIIPVDWKNKLREKLFIQWN